LANTEQAIDDLSFKEQLLSSLPSTYGTLVTVIDEKEEDISVQDTIRKIQHEEFSIQKNPVISPNTSAASGQALDSSNPFGGQGSYRGGYRGGY